MEIEILECDWIATGTTFTAWNVKCKTRLEDQGVKEGEDKKEKN